MHYGGSVKALQGVEGRVVWAQQPAPACDVGGIRIRVGAAGLNRADLLQRAGLYPPPPGVSQVLGLECAGIVSEVGAGCDWQVGDRVCALLAGGVGSAAIQLCRAFGSPCWVSVGSPERLAYCEALGAQGGALRGDEPLQALGDFGPFDVILDPVGGNYAALNLGLLAQDGRWVNIGLMGGRKAELDFALLLGKRIQLIGSTLRSRDEQFKAALLHDLQQFVWRLFAEGRLKPNLQGSFPVEEAEAAFAELASNRVNGKLVLVIDPTLV